MTIYRMNGAAKESLVGGGVTESDLDNAKNQAVNEAKQYTNTQVNNNKPKKASYTGNLTYSNKVHCERYGDVVCATMNSSSGTKLSKSGTSAGQLPVGYRPITAVSTICRYGTNPSDVTGIYIDNIGFLTVNTDGTVSWGFSTEPPDVQRWTWSISYTTNDAFPGQ